MNVPPEPRSEPVRGPTPIGRAISRLMARTGYDREQAAAGLESAWDRAAPETLRGRSRPGTVRRGVLEVLVGHSAHVQELGFHKREVLARLAEFAPDAGITDVRGRLVADADGRR